MRELLLVSNSDERFIEVRNTSRVVNGEVVQMEGLVSQM